MLLPHRQGPAPRRDVRGARRRVQTAALFLLAAATACTGGRASGEAAAQAQDVLEARRAGVPDPEPGDRIVSFDVSRDGNPNIYHHYRELPDGTERLVRKDIDLNGNGRVDVWRFYDDSERLVKEAFDLDFDGVVDVWNFYDERGRIVRKEADLSLDGRTDLWKFYENGRLVRRERDTSGNGRADYFEFWEDGEIDRIGEDLNGDGTVDRWTRRQRD
jgi:hypothetical protein